MVCVDRWRPPRWTSTARSNPRRARERGHASPQHARPNGRVSPRGMRDQKNDSAHSPTPGRRHHPAMLTPRGPQPSARAVDPRPASPLHAQSARDPGPSVRRADGNASATSGRFGPQRGFGRRLRGRVGNAEVDAPGWLPVNESPSVVRLARDPKWRGSPEISQVQQGLSAPARGGRTTPRRTRLRTSPPRADAH